MKERRKIKGLSNGFTLVELLVVLALLAVMIAVAVPRITGHIGTANKAVDEANLKILNDATILYATFKEVPISKVFTGITTDQNRMQKLYNEDYLDYMLAPRQTDLAFAWNTEEDVWELVAGDPIMPAFIALLANSGIDLTAFLGKSPIFNFGGSSNYDPNSWNGYLEKLLEAGDVASNKRATDKEGTNVLGYENPISGKGTVIDFNNWNSIKNTYSEYLPPAIFITNSSSFDYTAPNHDYIMANLNTLKGTMVFYKNNSSPNSEVQVYYINEDGSLSDLYSIEDVLGS